MLLYYLLPVAAFWVVAAVYLIINSRKIGFLRDVPAGNYQPPLAIIIAVRNEEDDVEQALISVCNLNYNNYRIIVVNDRSTDGTAEILKRVADRYPQITIETVTSLPKGWLGKNHAMYRGYLSTTEEWMLFTDADIVFKPDTLSKAMNYVQTKQLDHLVLMPHITSRSALFNAILHTFATMFELRIRPWAVSDPDSDAAIGVGAFNLLKRTAYQVAGTHTVIRLRPDDDLKLGMLIKQAGFKQGLLYGQDEISLEWYTSVRQFINGLMKNVFAVMNYKPAAAIINALGTFLVFALPVPLALLSVQPYAVLTGVIMLIAFWAMYRFKPGSRQWWHFLTIPYAGALMAFIILRSMYVTLKHKGIYWRDSFYPLKELKGD